MAIRYGADGWTSLPLTDARGYALLIAHISFHDTANHGPNWLVRTWTKARSNQNWAGYDWSLGYCSDSYYMQCIVLLLLPCLSVFEDFSGTAHPRSNNPRREYVIRTFSGLSVQVSKFLLSGLPALSAWPGLSVSPLV